MDQYNIPLNEAMECVLNKASVLGSEKLPISDSLGRVLTADIIASYDIPHFDRSPLDGYAFRACDTQGASKNTPVKLSVVEEIRAGDSPHLSLGVGQAVKILTGAPVPPGADAVTKYEEAEYTDYSVTIFETFASGSNIVYAGEDIKKGQTAAKSGSIIDPPLIGIFASLGITHVDVIKRPTVALCTFGNELIEVDTPLLPAKIRNSNNYTFSSYLKADGLSPLDLGIVPDDMKNIGDVIKQGVSQADMLITTGGVSVGDYDLVRQTLKNIGAEILFWRMNIKPGSAILASKLDGKFILSLSGNPAAAIVGYKLLGVPYLRKLMGYLNPAPELFKLKLLDPIKKVGPGMRLLPGALKIIDGETYFKHESVKGNGVLSSFVGCNLLGVIPAGASPLSSGDYIEAFMYLS